MGSRIATTALVALLLSPLAASASRTHNPRAVLLITGETRKAWEISTLDVSTGRVRHIAQGYGAAWSPDGNHIAFSSGGNIFVVDRLGRHRQQLTHDTLPDGDPVWSPDGKQIAYIQDQKVDLGLPIGDETKLMVVDVASAGARPLTDDLSPKGYLTWSPDGTKVFFATGMGRWQTGYVDVTTGRIATEPGKYPIWSPDGRHFAYFASAGGDGLAIAKANGSDPQTVLHIRDDRSIVGLGWSPSGGSLVFGYGRDQSWRRWLEVLDLRTGRVRELTRAYGHADVTPSWSPDGKLIAFSRRRFRADHVVVGVIRITDRHVRVFDAPPMGQSYWPIRWEPGGN